MDDKRLINKLELAYAPMTAYEFAVTKNDTDIEQALFKASLYLIAQRAVITFENIVPDENEYKLNFEIHQKGNPNILKCRLPLAQSIVNTNENDTILIAFNDLDKSTTQNFPPYFNIHGFSLVKQQKEKEEFLIWFSPEKLLQNWWKGYIECEIEGDYKSFLRYQVHYVGKATKQGILKRLTGHSTFQDILSLEESVTEKQLPANEIVILSFEFEENIQMQTFGSYSDIKSMTSALLGENYPEQETIFLDSEKALIQAMKPNYNKELFKNYPISKDGLYDLNYKVISYSFIDPITLIYDEGEIIGKKHAFGGDLIVISDNKEFRLIKN
ncbi:hypothetical protein [Plebeiibacterium sediminum]|uniref:Uncharacterized protein n=1 Tax=Plebeiibacterium sediminum TaxID=2992112 RepID=A0AAE3M7L5_9BACT|nr:hypothetical protein [Plebeiobacterium sediminum]MCW3788300.1 hypothetical protein [Plebeiobacterium sediminum]